MTDTLIPDLATWHMDHDPEACLLLEAWARRPWDHLCLLQVADRLEELGEPIGARYVRQSYGLSPARLEAATGNLNRRERARKMKVWREWLRRIFGPFDKKNTLPCVSVLADTPTSPVV